MDIRVSGNVWVQLDNDDRFAVAGTSPHPQLQMIDRNGTQITMSCDDETLERLGREIEKYLHRRVHSLG